MRVLSAAVARVTDKNQSSLLETTNSVPTLLLASDRNNWGFSMLGLRFTSDIVLSFLEPEKEVEKKPGKKSIRTLLLKQH